MAVHPPRAYPRWPRIAGFECDAGNREKCGKHGVSLAAIEAMFHRPVAIFRDAAHSRHEERFKGTGETDAGRTVVIVCYAAPTRRRELHPPYQRAVHAREGDREL